MDFEYGTTRSLDFLRQRNKDLCLIRSLLHNRLLERMACTHDTPSAALRLVASNNLCLPNESDIRIVLKTQHVDGRWTGWIYCYGSSGILFGSDALTSALGVAALEGGNAAL